LRKILTSAVVSLLILLTFSVLLPKALANGLVAPYTTNIPVIDGSVTGTEWNDAPIYGAWLRAEDGSTDILSYIYLKHDCTNIYIGLKVFAEKHVYDGFSLYFDEGDDGSYGRGSHDGILTYNQEDSKCVGGQTTTVLTDGCYKVGGWWAFIGGDFQGARAFLSDHWEVEFAIPFVGTDGEPGSPTGDVSDLVCTIADTIGIKIQYNCGPNYFYPAGDQYQIETYTTLSFAPPTGVIAEVPFGTILASTAMLIALIGFVGFKHFRPRFRLQ